MALNVPRLSGDSLLGPVRGTPTQAEFNNLTFAVVARIQTAFRRAVAEGVGEAIIKGFDQFAKSINNVSANKQVFLAANEVLATNMRTAVLASYDQVVEGERQFPPYRVGDRHSGALRPALQNRNLIVATPQGIGFVDETILNSQANHWQRLQYGAGGAGGRPAIPVELVFEGEPLAFLVLGQGPRPAFRMPFGTWTEEGFFHPRGKPTILTKGIRARRFLDAGLVALQRDFPQVYGDVFKQIETQVFGQSANEATSATTIA